MALWNQKYLPAPPTNTYKSKTNDLDLVKLRNALQDCMRHFKNEDFMIRETALLSRILYRMKMKFRSSKEFKSLEKINHSLNIYLNTNMGRDLKNIFDLIPSKYQREIYLPTRNMLSYILVRIQGLVKLMERVFDTCHVAAYEIHNRICLGHFWKIYIVLFALVSRIYVLVKFNTKLLCELYGKLLPHSNKMENPGRNWLPDGYHLPNDLREWIGVEWVYEEEFIDLTKDLTLQPPLKILDFFNLVDEDDDDEVQFCDEYILVDKEDINIAKDFRNLKPVEDTFTRNRMRGFSINEDDIGVDIAEIIELNETNMKNPPLRNTDNDKDEESHFIHTNKSFDVEDIGEDISSTEDDRNNQLQIINLDETYEYHLNIDRMVKSTNIRSNLTQSPKKNPSKNKTKNKKIKNNNNNAVINLADDSEVIVIPETPGKLIRDDVKDNSVIILDDTFGKTSVHLNKSVKKRNLNKPKKKGALNCSSLINVTNEVIDKNNKTKSSDARISLTLNDSNYLTPQIPLKERKKTREKALKRLKDSGKMGESNLTNDSNEAQDKKQGEKNITESLNDFNNLTPDNPKKKLNIQEKTIKQFNDKIKTAESSNFTTGKKRKRENEEISSKNIIDSLNYSNNLTPSRKKKLKTQKGTLKQLTDKMKIDETSSFTTENKTEKKIIQEIEEMSPSLKNMTESLNDSNKLTKKEINPRKKNLKRLKDKRKIGENDKDKKGQWENEEISPSRKNITKSQEQDNDSGFSSITRLKRIKGRRFSVLNKYNESKSSKHEREDPNVVRLTLVKETPKREHTKPNHEPKNEEKDSQKKNIATPLKGTLVIDKLIVSDEASSSRENADQNIDMSREMSESKEDKNKIFEKSRSTRSREVSGNIEYKKKNKKRRDPFESKKSRREKRRKERSEGLQNKMSENEDVEMTNVDEGNLVDPPPWQPFTNEPNSKFLRNDRDLRRNDQNRRRERIPFKERLRKYARNRP